ncbi:alpha/beta fold hydrolase [Nocardia otitidiscaviarum]|uniref:alpha/beta fold hydrolase n=1 Tax=Nocardia otitidiscaviarum TaxID=1823 RepID=UPI0004A6D1E4|nr:alpha/beta hydrolase [Nocardia otitidiscaviarum]MBF6134810.1 alpha/beta fold hydrolase [Nocardia otitidiscaviarum]MBF6485564.1 alpha/beta fold hydrolase [Nocardia otitidiscaviarum]
MSFGKWFAALCLVLPFGIGCATADTAARPELDRFHHQRVDWRPCDQERLDEAGAQCADVTVPLDYGRTDGQTTTVAISRIAADPERKRGVMLSNPGGPGGSGLDFMVDVGAAMTPEVKASYDLIGMDPRGVGRSAPVRCDWPRGIGLQAAGPDAASFAASVASQAELAARCATAEGERLRHITTRNTARDMDVIRAVLDAERISYFGTSYGTYLGAVYTELFPDRVDRMVLDSAVDPERYGPVDMVRDMGPANEAALDLWADWTAGHERKYGLGATREQVRATVLELLRRSGEQPIRIGEFAVSAHELPLMLFTGLDDPRQYGMVAEQVALLRDAAWGLPVAITPELDQGLAFVLAAEPEDNSAQMAIMCGDVDAPRDPLWYWNNLERSRTTAPVFGSFTDNITPCAFWAAPAEPRTVVDNSVPALIVQSTGDTRTTYANAEGMHRALSASRLVTLRDVPIHWIFGRYPNTCVYDAVNAYFRDGTLPESDITCAAD